MKRSALIAIGLVVTVVHAGGPDVRRFKPIDVFELEYASDPPAVAGRGGASSAYATAWTSCPMTRPSHLMAKVAHVLRWFEIHGADDD